MHPGGPGAPAALGVRRPESDAVKALAVGTQEVFLLNDDRAPLLRERVEDAAIREPRDTPDGHGVVRDALDQPLLDIAEEALDGLGSEGRGVLRILDHLRPALGLDLGEVQIREALTGRRATRTRGRRTHADSQEGLQFARWFAASTAATGSRVVYHITRSITTPRAKLSPVSTRTCP